MKVLIAGDFCQTYRVDETIKKRKYCEMFEEVKPLISQSDYSIVNFEFPIVLDSLRAKPIQKCGPNFQGTIESIDAIKYAGFDCCTLANNHILDQGEQCCLDTKNELEKAGIDTVGVGKNLEDASTILYKSMLNETLAIINCCEHEFSIATCTAAGANPLNLSQQYFKIKEARKNADYVMVIVHGGHEFFDLPSPRMQETYRFFIHAGADAVINHHQHCYSGYEVFNGKPIFYGLGNFLFDHKTKRNCFWNEGLMISIQFISGQNPRFHLIPYTQCNESVNVSLMHDDKLFYSEIKKKNIIISKDTLLREAVAHYYETCSKSELNIYNPYIKRLFRKLSAWHLLPMAFNAKQLTRIWNHIECESHRDKHIYALKQLLSKK